MAKSKAAQVAAAIPLKSVKEGRVAKPPSNIKAKEVAKAFVSKEKSAASKKKVESESEDDSEDDSEDESESDSDAEESDVEDAKPKGKANGKANSLKATVDDESDESSDSDEDEAPVKKANGTTAGAEDEDEDDSSEDEEVDSGKAAGKFEPDSDASDEDDDDDSSDDDEEEAKSETPKAAPVKVNGHSKVDAKDDDSEAEDDSDSSEEDSEDEDEDSPVAKAEAPKKRKAADEEESPTKKSRMEDESEDVPANATKNLFIGRMSWAMDDDALYDEFKSFGEIVSCRVVYDRDSGRSRGFGYVEFSKISEAIAAKDAKHESMVDGRQINVDFSQPRSAKPRESPQERSKKYGDVPSAPSDTIFIGNISFDATYDMVKETFEPYGNITRVSLPVAPDTGALKGFGYVSYSSIDEAKGALEQLTGCEIAGRRVRLDFAQPRADNGGSPRGGRGNFGGRGDRGGGRGGRDFGGSRGFGGGRGNFGSRGGGGRGGRGSSTNRGGFNDFAGSKITF